MNDFIILDIIYYFLYKIDFRGILERFTGIPAKHNTHAKTKQAAAPGATRHEQHPRPAPTKENRPTKKAGQLVYFPKVESRESRESRKFFEKSGKLLKSRKSKVAQKVYKVGKVENFL